MIVRKYLAYLAIRHGGRKSKGRHPNEKKKLPKGGMKERNLAIDDGEERRPGERG